MNIDDRAHRAAEDLAAKATTANMPAVPSATRRRFRPALAFAAGAAAVAALVLVPLVFLGGPREPEEPAVTTPTSVPTTQPTPTTQSPTTDPTAAGVVTTVTIDDLATLVPAAPSPWQTAELRWGTGSREIGQDEKGYGPCCFDVAADGTVVILDSAKLRMLTVNASGGTTVIAQWEAGDFVPDAMVISARPRDDVIFVLGMTNRPGRPHDLITMTLDGTVIERGETIVTMPVEMVESAGSVWATAWRTQIGWVQLATEVGDILDLEDQGVVNGLLLGDRGRLEISNRPEQTGVIISRTDVDGNGIRYELDFDGETWGHFAIPTRDGILVTASTTRVGTDGSVGRVVAILDGDGNVVDGFTWQGSREFDMGPYGLTRLGPDGAIYELYGTEQGVEVRRFPLAEAVAFDALVARAGYGRAMTIDDRTLWIAGPLQVTDQGGEWAEILQVDTRTRALVAIHEVPAGMHAIDAIGNTVWMARAGDGALPQNLVGRLDARTGEIELRDLGDLSTRDLAATVDGVWLASWNGGEPADLAFVSGASLEVEFTVPMPDGAEPQAMQLWDGVLWIASYDGRVLRYDTASAEFLESFDVGLSAIDIVVEEDLFGSDLSVWVSGANGGVVKLRSDGSIVATHSLDGRSVHLAGNGAQGTIWAITDAGALYYVLEDVDPYLIEDTGVAGVNAIVTEGGPMWVLGETLALVEFGQ